MQIIIEIPKSEIPKQQDIIEIPVHFVARKVCEAGGYGFDVLPEGHGKLIDADELLKTFWEYCCYGDFGFDEAEDLINAASTIIEANKVESKE